MTLNISRLNLKLKLLPEWFDVDTPNDLRLLREELVSGKLIQNDQAETRRWLIKHAKIFERET